MAWVGVITNAGLSLFESYIAQGVPVNINVVKTGKGSVSESAMKTATALNDEVTTGSIIAKTVTVDGVQIKMSVGPYTTGYTLTEVGLFASYTEGGTTTSVMVALFQNTSGVAIPTVSEFPDFNLVLTSILDISNSEYLTITVASGSFVLVDQGSSNAGKFLIVGSDGIVYPTEVPFANGGVY